MSWFIARLLLRADTSNSKKSVLYSEEFVLLKAESNEQADIKALQKGKEMQHAYRSITGQRVHWKLVDVLEVTEVMERRIGDGAELYSRLYRRRATAPKRKN